VDEKKRREGRRGKGIVRGIADGFRRRRRRRHRRRLCVDEKIMNA